MNAALEPWSAAAAPPPVDELRLEAIEAKLERVLAALAAAEERRGDLREVIDDVLPIANGAVRVAIRRMDALERDGTLAAAAALARAASAPPVLAAAGRAAAALGAPPTPVKPLALLRALREPAVARGMGVLLHLLRALGAEPNDTNAPAAAPAHAGA